MRGVSGVPHGLGADRRRHLRPGGHWSPAQPAGRAAHARTPCRTGARMPALSRLACAPPLPAVQCDGQRRLAGLLPPLQPRQADRMPGMVGGQRRSRRGIPPPTPFRPLRCHAPPSCPSPPRLTQLSCCCPLPLRLLQRELLQQPRLHRLLPHPRGHLLPVPRRRRRRLRGPHRQNDRVPRGAGPGGRRVPALPRGGLPQVRR